MKENIPQIAVLLTCFNRKEKTAACLKSLFSQQGLNDKFNFHYFLVDDGSSDGTGEYVRTHHPTVNIIHGDGNLYWNGGMYVAWTSATKTGDYDFYLWLNDDISLFENAILILLTTYTSIEVDSIVCGATCSAVTKKYTYGAKDIKGNDILPNGTIQEAEIMNGNCVLISRKTFQIVGYNDNLFRHAIGDYDYGLRARKKGIKIITPAEYIATCEQHEKLPIWCRPEVPFFKRVKSLYSPLGYSHPYYFFIYEKRHYGIFTATKHLFSMHLRVMFPSLWLKK